MFEVDGEDDSLKRVKINDISFAMLENKSVADIVTKTTKSLSTKFRLPLEFLQLPASQWAKNREYQTAVAVAGTVAVVNDNAERGVALIQQFSGSLTNNEEQLQYLLQVVAENRKRYPPALKQTFIDSTEATSRQSKADTELSDQ